MLEKRLKEYIRKLVQEMDEELDEITTTANIDGFDTPYAFLNKKSKKDKEKRKKTATQMGYTIVGEGRKSKDALGVRLVIAIHNNVDAIVELVRDDKRDPKEVMETMSNPLLNSVNGVLKHKYKPNAKPAYTLKRDLRDFGDLTNQQRLDIFKKELKKFKKIVEALIKKPTKVNVKRLDDAWRAIWNYHYGGNIGLNGQGSHDNTIIESVNEGRKPKRPVNRWLELKNDETRTPNQKLALGLKELKYQLAEVEMFFRWYNKIRSMNELNKDKYWKRTNTHIYKIKERLINIVNSIKELDQ